MKSVATLSLLTIAAALASCGSSHDAPKPVISGVFLDGAVEGLEYVAGSAARASTGTKGEFSCFEGDTVSFHIDGIALGSAACAATIAPLQLAGVTDPKDPKVVNRLLALQLLDDDSAPANGIKLNADVKAGLSGKSIDFAAFASVSTPP